MPKVELADYAGREQAYVKHRLLAEYLSPLAYKVGSAWDSIVYVDAFSGPWQTNRPDLADTSFAIAIERLRNAQLGLRERGKNRKIVCILIEEDKAAFRRLEAFATAQSSPSFLVFPICGKFADKIPAIKELIRKHAPNPFKFAFLDPKGWADIPMRQMQSFLKDRSCEVLINLMTRHIIRFLKEEDRADSYRNLFGRDAVLEELRGFPSDERAEKAVQEYSRSLKRLCGFKYVSSAVILDPVEESVRYYLVYGTNDFHGVDVFKRAESTAARIQDDIRYETDKAKSGQGDLLLEGGSKQSRLTARLRIRYCERARADILKMLTAKMPNKVSYAELYCEAMAYPLVTPDDLGNWLVELGQKVELKPLGSGKRKKPSPEEDDWILVKDVIT